MRNIQRTRERIELIVSAPEASGIYTLGFQNGDRYIGQAKNVRIRVRSHFSRWQDIVSIEVQQCTENNLDRAELDAIALAEEVGFRLRNISLISQPLFSDVTLGTKILSAKDLADFAIGRTLPDQERRPIDQMQLERYRQRFEKKVARLQLDELANFLSLYTSRLLPAPKRTERVIWASSLLENGWLISRINVGWQEVLTILEERGELQIKLQCRESKLSGGLDGLIERFPALQWDESPYVAGGVDQVSLFCRNTTVASALIAEPDVAAAIRHLNATLARRGSTPFGKSHCYQMADLCFRNAQTKPVENCEKSA
jgi:hypothetical protein